MNKLRATLGGEPIKSLNAIKHNLSPPAASGVGVNTGNTDVPANIVENITRVGTSVTEDHARQLDEWDSKLREDVSNFNATSEWNRLAQQAELVDLGLTLIGDATDRCPLCDATWEPAALAARLEDKISESKSAAEAWKTVRSTADRMLRWIGETPSLLDRIHLHQEMSDESAQEDVLRRYNNGLGSLQAALSDPLSYTIFREDDSRLTDQIGLPTARKELRSLYAAYNKSTTTDARQQAWDTLTRCEENVVSLDKARKCEQRAVNTAYCLQTLSNAYVRARDDVLSRLYGSIEHRFTELYRELHAPDEQTFDADMTPRSAGLDLTVDFHGNGKVAPFALHSEGHQDSMALCLFLALAEQVQGARLGFCILDDVVMAVDTGHRRNVAKLLKSLDQRTQFIITTHDQTWVRQLRAEGCISAQNLTHFIGWSIDDGPTTDQPRDFLGGNCLASRTAFYR